MRIPTLHDKLLELYLKNDDPDNSAVKRSVENYLHKIYPGDKIKRIVDDLKKKHDYQKESEEIRSRNHLASYIDSIITSKIRDSFKSSTMLDIDDLDELKFKALVKRLMLHFGYEMLFIPKNYSNVVDIIVHRSNIKIAVLAVKCAPGCALGLKTVRQIRYIANHYHCEQAILVSSTYFDEDAINEAKEIGVVLLDRDKLQPLIQDLIDNRQKEEKEYLINEVSEYKNTIFLDGQIKFPKAKVQVVFIKYYIDEDQKCLVFDGELVNEGKKPVANLTVDIKIFDRSGECIYRKSLPAHKDHLESKEKTSFKLSFNEIVISDCRNLCRYELKLEYNNVYSG